ncbi:MULTISPECIES: NAD(P)H-hydrate dehydratase [unclassified Carboxylicivirga]|uniref:NAD(P)H-hydrate dehydratase n=1 Tax=Carboxylicivirga TaxID=1628153 RepID=UPI003D3533B3
MKIFPVSQIANIDRYTIAHEPIAAIDLMERAAQAFYRRFVAIYPHGDVSVLVGPGNNGGDALVVARLLLLDGRRVQVFLMSDSVMLGDEAALNLKRLRKIQDDVQVLISVDQFDRIDSQDIVVDGLFGSGLNRPLKGLYKQLVQYINTADNAVVSIDVPSGLFGEDNPTNDMEGIVKADLTISFQFPKLAFLLPENEAYVGQWQVVDIGLHPHIIQQSVTGFSLSESHDVKILLKKHSRFSHKGCFGHALLLAGNYGKMGAAVLASKACLKAGVGLLTTHVPRLGYPIIQTAVPEAMASIDRSDILLSEFPQLDAYAALAIGPGIGTKPNTFGALRALLQRLQGKPIVLDADALNMLAAHPYLWESVPDNAILTPHPGEFDRLAGKSTNAYDRLQKAVRLAKEKSVILVLKGAYTAVIAADGHCYFNASGNYGMATAGSGDVLTGMLLALLAQGYLPLEAARLGVYLHGLAADLLLGQSAEEAIVASDIISNIGSAYKHLKNE